ncbi:MAG: ribosomal-processing cysteine protease Prp [Bacilli bacterium]|nr:ribosomal-processing cysteine protease Prp [Bacilli bacterium]
MIKVALTTHNNHFVSLLVTGHANAGEYGQDIVCAGVSLAVQGGCNALKDDEDGEGVYELERREGYFFLKAKKELSSHDEIVIETIIAQISSIAEQYPKSVKLERK